MAYLALTLIALIFIRPLKSALKYLPWLCAFYYAIHNTFELDEVMSVVLTVFTMVVVFCFALLKAP